MEDRSNKELGFYEYDVDEEKMLRNIILRIHHKEDLEKIKKDFYKYFHDVPISEISEFEEKILKEGIKSSVANDMPRIHEILAKEKKKEDEKK